MFRLAPGAGRSRFDCEDLASHKLPLDDAPHAYEIFQRKEEGAIKVLLQP
jgi:threonine dehydrogenase-like Zn-dependent dehydrogenase